jgi:hypothetical protein
MHRAIKGMLRWVNRWTVGIVLLAVFVTVAHYLGEANRKRQEQAAARVQHRQMGKLGAPDPVDPSKAPQERVLSRQQTQPVYPAIMPTPSATPKPTPVPQANGPVQLASYVFWEQPTPSPTPVQEVRRAKPEPRLWLRTGTQIPCQLINSIDTSHMNTLVKGIVTRDVHESCDGRDEVVIPAGSIVVCWANATPVRDRIEVAGRWIVSFFDGRELEFDGIALDREVADETLRQFGPEDGTPGIPGQLVDSDRWASFRALVKMLLMSAAQATQGVAVAATQGALGGGHGDTTIAMPDTTPLLADQLDQIFEGKRADDKRYLHVPASTSFYVATVGKLWPEFRHIAGKGLDETLPQETEKEPTDPMDKALKLEEKLLQKASTQQQEKPHDENKPRHFTFDSK